MTMHNKICFLLVVIFLVVVQSNSADANDRRGASTGDRKTRGEDTADKDKTEQVDDNYQQQLTYRRYSPYDLFSNTYRLQPRRPSTNEESNSNDWSSYENLITNFPGSPASSTYMVETSPLANTEPTCYSLLDLQYPQFADICGTLPQVRYSLPNSLGHLERWQIAQVLSTLLSSPSPTSSNPICYRSLRLLICPLLFPPCPTRIEPPAVLPCQLFCRAVKSQCQAPSLDLLPCDFLPAISELCPVNQAPYSTLLSSFAQPTASSGGVPPQAMTQSQLSQILAQSGLSFATQPSAYPSQMTQSGVQPSNTPQLFFPSTGVPSSRSYAPSSPYNQQFNTEQYMADTLTPILVNTPRFAQY